MPAPTPRAWSLFESLCGPARDQGAAQLRAAVRAHAEEIRAAADADELLPVDLAESLAARLDDLLAAVGQLPVDHVHLVVGAARYFVSTEDDIGYTSGVLGLDDDVAVFNAVMRRIGREDLEIDA
jgi:hypothetical protein